MGADSSPKQNVFKANMQKYRIKFESGCEYDDHCNNNGINDEDSDYYATCTLGGICYCSLPTSKTQYHGFGCTRTGKGNAKDKGATSRNSNHGLTYKRSIGGNIPLMQCDKNRLFASKVTTQGAYVSKDEPTKVYFEAPLEGSEVILLNEIYIDGQVRTVIKVESSKAIWIKVDIPFTVYEKSNDDYIVPVRSSVYVIARLGGVGITCATTDMPKITSIYTDDPTSTISTVLIDEEDNVVTEATKTSLTRARSLMKITPHDPHEVEIGDRIRISSKDVTNERGGIKCASDGDMTCGTYQTHTVDKIYYSTVNDQTSSANPPDLEIIGAATSFYLNTYVNLPSEVVGNDIKYKRIGEREKRFIYNDQRGTLEGIECGNRGICDVVTGLCKCFRNFIDDDCSKMEYLPSL